MGVLARLYDFIAGTRITSASVDAELNQLVTGHNDHETLLINLAAGTGLTDGVVTSAKIANDTLMNVDVNTAAAIAWTKISKSGSSIADLATKSAADLTSGTLDVARLPTAIPATSIAGGGVTDTEYGYIGTLSSDAQTQITARQVSSEKGQANGYAPLDGTAKIDVSYLPASIVGQIEYQATWNATTDSPSLPAASGVKGHYYVVSTAGTYLTIAYNIGDWIISNGTAWEKVDNTDAVSSVFGRTGIIAATTNDYTFAQIDKSTSSLADLTTRSAADLSSGILLDARMPNLTGDITTVEGAVATTITALAVTNAKVATGIDAVKLADGSVSNTEYQYIGTLSSNAQDQLDAKVSKSTTLSAITVDGTVSGEIAVVTMAASCAVYDLVYSSATGYNKAKADAIATAKCKGMCIETGTGARQVLKHGYVKNNLWAWTVGGDLYLDPSTAGGMTQTLPSTVGQFVKIVGHAESATVIYLNIDNTYVEV